MAPFGALRYDRERLSNPYQTHDLCPANLCPTNSIGDPPCKPIPLACLGRRTIRCAISSVSASPWSQQLTMVATVRLADFWDTRRFPMEANEILSQVIRCPEMNLPITPFCVDWTALCHLPNGLRADRNTPVRAGDLVITTPKLRILSRCRCTMTVQLASVPANLPCRFARLDSGN